MSQPSIPNKYTVFFYRECPTIGGCVRDSVQMDAWTAQDAAFQMDLRGKTQFANDRYFRVLDVEPCVSMLQKIED